MSLHGNFELREALRWLPLPGIEDGLSRLPFLTLAGERWIGGVLGEGCTRKG